MIASLSNSTASATSATLAPSPLEHLNPPQRAAAEYGIATPEKAPLLIIAGAGSGKTNTLAHRVGAALAAGADPARILLLTFSRRAAMELTRRSAQVAARFANQGLRAATLPWAGTFHSIGARLLREYAESVGLSPQFTIQDRADSEDLIALVRQDLGLARTEKRFPTKATCLAIYSRAINSDAPLATLLRDHFPWCAEWELELRELFSAYTAEKQRQHVLDYDDLLLYWAHMVKDPALAAEIGGRFDHLLVDEYQDTNRLQAEIIVAMKPCGQGVTAVGDDAQSIYSFRAATVRNILDFPGQFAQPAKVITLDRNYRSTDAILDACNAVIGLATERFTKDLWTERRSAEKPFIVTVQDEQDQARAVAEKILAYREQGIKLKSQAVLFRNSHHSAQLELELTRRNIPFVKFGGLKFLETAHIKDLLAILRWAENPNGRVAGFRVLQMLPGIGPATARKLLDQIDAGDPVTAVEAFSPPPAAAASWERFVPLYLSLRAGDAGWPAEFNHARNWYAELIDGLYEDAALRMADLVQLEAMAATFASRERFLTDLTLDPPAATSDEAGDPLLDEDYLTLSTIHSAKGREWQAVQVLNVVDGGIPVDLGTGSSESLEEERRLLYVAMTRARDHLHLMVPRRFYVHNQAAMGDKYVYALRSRFIPGQLLSRFEETTWPARGDDPAVSIEKQPRIDLAARIRQIWK